VPATLAVASNCVALSAVPYVIGAGVAQVMAGVVFGIKGTVAEADTAVFAWLVAVTVTACCV
jgi:hypothetical protein